jgi:hypothetical protein
VFAAVLLLLFQAAATMFVCPGDGRSEYFPSAHHVSLAAADDASSHCGASETQDGVPDSQSNPFLPNKEPAKRPYQDCPACQIFGCHGGVVLAQQSHIDGVSVSGGVLWLSKDEPRPGGEFAFAHNRDPPLFFPV